MAQVPAISSSVAKDVIFWGTLSCILYLSAHMIHLHYQSRSQFPPFSLVTIQHGLCRLHGRVSLYVRAYRKRVRVTASIPSSTANSSQSSRLFILLVTCREAGLQLSQNDLLHRKSAGFPGKVSPAEARPPRNSIGMDSTSAVIQRVLLSE